MMSSSPVLRNFVVMALSAGAVIAPSVAFASCGDISRPCDLDPTEVRDTYYPPIPPPPPCQTCGGGSEEGGDNSGDGGGASDGGNDSSTPPAPPQCRSQDNFVIKGYKKALAAQTARSVIADPEHRRLEFGTVTYRDAGGTIRQSEIVRGASGSIPRFPVDLMAALSVPGSAVLDVFHNHPADSFTGPHEATANKNPSTCSGCDWDVATALVNMGANSNLMQLHILGPDDVLREFDYNSRETYVFRIRPRGPDLLVTGATVPTDLTPSLCEEAP